MPLLNTFWGVVYLPVSAQAETSGTLGSPQGSGGSLLLIISQGTEMRRNGPGSAGDLVRISLYIMYLRGQRKEKVTGFLNLTCFSNHSKGMENREEHRLHVPVLLTG